MQTQEEIISNLNNIEYYSKKIKELLRKELEKGIKENAEESCVDVVNDCIGMIDNNCKEIEVMCAGIREDIDVINRYERIM